MFEPSPLHIQPAKAPSSQMQTQLQSHLRHIHVLRPGLHVHADELVDAQDFTAAGDIEQGLRLVLLLEGTVDLSYGEQRVQLSSGASTPEGRGWRNASPRALLVSVAQQERFERRARRGAYARRLSVGIGWPWLDQAMGGRPVPSVQAFAQRHLALHEWHPSPRIVAMAEQIVRAPALSIPFLNLYLESRVLELVGEGLSSLDGGLATMQASRSSALLPHEHRRVRALYEFLQTEEAFDLSLDDMARQAGSNPNTLQKHFCAVYGTTIFECLRERRLQRARQALEQDGVTVSQAAELAGYTSAANFATAYRKRFGTTPKLARHRF